MKAIIYTSNAGSTVQYAQLLADELHLPVYSAKEAKKKVPAHSEIIYLGWIMAGGIKGYKDMVTKGEKQSSSRSAVSSAKGR